MPIYDMLWPSTVDRWRKEGLPQNKTPAEYFGYEMLEIVANTTPRFPHRVLKEEEEYIIERNPLGEITRNRRDYASLPEVIDSPVKGREDWERIKARLRPEGSRVNWSKRWEEFQRAYSAGKFILYSTVFGYSKAHRYMGQERLLIALLEDPELVKDMYMTDAELAIAMCDRMIQRGFRFDGAFLYCDLGYRNGLLFSPQIYREQLFPVQKMMCDYFNARGMPVILHTDGDVREIIPDFIEAGISCLQPLEVKAGMDVRELKRKYGDRLSFMGGIDVRLMHEDSDRIEEEIRNKFEVAKRGGGYIYHSDHTVPNDVSFEQYKRVMKLVRRYGGY